MERFIASEEGQTASEHMLILSALVIALVAAAYVFVPMFQSGVGHLGADVADKLGHGGAVAATERIGSK
jgi:Flp pilus assembly pilin Flp